MNNAEKKGANLSIMFDCKRRPIKLFRWGILFAALGIVYYSTFENLSADWIRDPDYSHGFLIPILSLFFVWQRRCQLRDEPAAPSSLGLPFIIIGLMMLVLGNLAAESFTMRISFLVVVAGLSVFLLGWGHFKLLLWPIAFLVFMIPVPSILMQKITFPMQLFASRVAEESLRIFAVPVLREGNIIYLPETTLEIAKACSGIRSLMSLLVIGVLFAYLTKCQVWQKVLLVIGCFPIAIVVNSLRVSTTGILANYYGKTVSEGFFHGFSGYVLFVVAFALLALIKLVLFKVEQCPACFQGKNHNS